MNAKRLSAAALGVLAFASTAGAQVAVTSRSQLTAPQTIDWNTIAAPFAPIANPVTVALTGTNVTVSSNGSPINCQAGTCWGGGFTNGRFQLERAIETAARRATLGEPYQPLQEEKLLLAGGYEELKAFAKAREMYLLAAEAFLDTDQLQPAHDTLSAAGRITTPASATSDKARAELVQRVIATRRQVAAKGPGPDPKDKDQAWLRDDATQPFVLRQRFKVWADMADKAQAAGVEDAAATYAGIAFESALRTKSMVGTADLVRFEHAKSLSLARADIAQGRNAIIASRAIQENGGASWPVYVPSEGRTTYVSLSADATLAGRFDAAIRREPVLFGKAVRYTVDNGRIALTVPGADASVKAVVDRLQTMHGLNSRTMARSVPTGSSRPAEARARATRYRLRKLLLNAKCPLAARLPELDRSIRPCAAAKARTRRRR